MTTSDLGAVWTPLVSEQGKLWLAFIPCCCDGGCEKACLNDWPLVNFYGLMKAKNPGQYQTYKGHITYAHIP